MGLDPDCAHVIERLEAGGWTPLTRDPPSEAREHYRKLSLARRGDDYVPEDIASVRDVSFDGPAGPIGARVYAPVGARDAVVVWLHGGGWVIGDLDTHDAICRTMANQTRVIVASIDYRLAPEAPHPGPLDDCMAALRWAAAEWPDHKLAVAGDSAGGGLAAGCALRARDEGWPSLAAQLLIYPGIDPKMTQPSIVENGTGYFLGQQDMEWFYGHYLPEPWMRTDQYVNLLEAGNLVGLPPAVVTTAEFDPLRDEAARYVERMGEAGVSVRMIPGPGLIHGYFGLVELVPTAARIADEVRAAFAELL